MLTATVRTTRGPRLTALAGVMLAGALLSGCAGSPNRSSAALPGSGASSIERSALQQALYAHYRDWEGVPYRYGGVDRRGVDCSSFVRQIMQALGAPRLPRTTHGQARRGVQVAAHELSAGDLVFFRTGHKSRHVGIYVGEGRFMHASTSRGVTMSALDNSYWRRHYWQSRRLALED